MRAAAAIAPGEVSTPITRPLAFRVSPVTVTPSRSVAPSLRVLPEVVAAVNGRIEILMDGGIRRGSDVV